MSAPVTSFHLTGVEIGLLAWLAAVALATTCMCVQSGRANRRRVEAAKGLPHRVPDAAAGKADETSVRLAHLDAVWAQCLASRPYVDALLGGFEAEVTGLLELGLELDDQSPKPSEDA